VSSYSAARIGLQQQSLSRRQQKPTKINNSRQGIFWPRQQISTEINKNQQSQQKSAKSIPVHDWSQQKATKANKNQQKSALNGQETYSNQHLETKINICEHWGWIAGQIIAYIHTQQRVLEHKGVCHG
jgi:hypothetical protein